MSAQELNRELEETGSELKTVRQQIQSLMSRKRILEVKFDRIQRQLNSVSNHSNQRRPPKTEAVVNHLKTYEPVVDHSKTYETDVDYSKTYESVVNYSKTFEPISDHSKTYESVVDQSNIVLKECTNFQRVQSPHSSVQTYKWSNKVEAILKNVFKLKAFRSHQLAAINATLSGKDCIVIMPTGGGKSLCFQLPALVNDGISVVVSPLLSLMEDQVNGLKELNIETSVINGQTSLEDTNEIMRSMSDPKSPLKMVYVTPEKVAQSKKFMSQMEKCYNNGRLSRIVIDEVHCCSQWGHDFRPDYKLLGVLKTQFPETPILGLTATATSAVITDIQKILRIEGCLVLKDSFFRPNLNYVIEKNNLKRGEQIQRIAFLLKNKYYNQSGIIYCLTIKDVEDVTQKLRSLGVKAGAYHASLPASQKSLIHKDWYKNKLQVIVATIAFGMGINKRDVRFIIHFSMSKALESYYQETGRAGRDGQPADCILYYRFSDVFRATTLVWPEKNGLENVYAMVRYCLDEKECRKKQIAVYFGDKWDNKCDNKCDNCLNQRLLNDIDCTKYLNDLIEIIENASKSKGVQKLTAVKLLDAWCGRGNKIARLTNVEPPNLPRDVCNSIIGLLLVDGYLKENIKQNQYTKVSYLEVTPKARKRPKHQKITYSLNCHQIPALQSTPTPNTSSEFQSIRKTKEKNTKTNISTESNNQKTKPKRKSLEIETIDDNEDMGSDSEFAPYFSKDFSDVSIISHTITEQTLTERSSAEYSRSAPISDYVLLDHSAGDDVCLWPSDIYHSSEPLPASDVSHSRFSRIESSSGSDSGSCTEFRAVIKTKKKPKKMRIDSDEEPNELICLD